MAIDDFYIRRLFQIESGGNPSAVTGSNRGLGQFSPDLERQYGITDQNRTDPAVQASAVQQEAAQFTPALRQVLGRDPTPGELYLAHQQGIGGATAHLTNPGQPAWQSMLSTAEGRQKGERWARAAIAGNPFTRNMDPNISSGDFAQGWINKFEQGGPQPSTSAQAVANASPNAAPALAAGPVEAPGGPVPGSTPSAGMGMLSGADLSGAANQGGPDIGMLAQRAMAMLQQPQQQMPAPPPISYPIPAALRARMQQAALGLS